MEETDWWRVHKDVCITSAFAVHPGMPSATLKALLMKSSTTGTPGATHDALVVLRADLAGGGSPLTHNKPSVGVMASRLA
eukprot:1147227-Pelagomonas_calceolata.AAC.1